MNMCVCESCDVVGLFNERSSATGFSGGVDYRPLFSTNSL